MKRNEGFMHGVNLGGWLSQCENEYEHYDEFITEADIAKIARLGADHVRLPIDYVLVSNGDGTYSEKGFGYITRCIEWCRKNGLHMIIDLHRAEGYIFDDFQNSKDFFYNEELQQKFLSLWREIATRYGKDADILEFELLNEIVDPAVIKEWNTLATRAIGVIREICPTIPIIVGGVNYNSIEALGWLELPDDEHLVYNFHCYEPFTFTHQNAYWVDEMPEGFHTTYPLTGEEYFDATPDREHPSLHTVYAKNTIDSSFFKELFKQAEQYAEEKGAALYCGEYGVIDQADVEDANRWFVDITDAFEDMGIGSAVWNYRAKDFGMLERPELKIPFFANVK